MSCAFIHIVIKYLLVTFILISLVYFFQSHYCYLWAIYTFIWASTNSNNLQLLLNCDEIISFISSMNHLLFRNVMQSKADANKEGERGMLSPKTNLFFYANPINNSYPSISSNKCHGDLIDLNGT